MTTKRRIRPHGDDRTAIGGAAYEMVDLIIGERLGQAERAGMGAMPSDGLRTRFGSAIVRFGRAVGGDGSVRPRGEHLLPGGRVAPAGSRGTVKG